MIGATTKRKADGAEFRISGQQETHEGKQWTLVPLTHGPVLNVSPKALRKDFSKLKTPTGNIEAEDPSRPSDATGWQRFSDAFWSHVAKPLPSEDAKRRAAEIASNTDALGQFEIGMTNYPSEVEFWLDKLIEAQNAQQR